MADEFKATHVYNGKPCTITAPAKKGDPGFAEGSQVPQSVVDYGNGQTGVVPTRELRLI